MALGDYASAVVDGFGAAGEAFSEREALVARLADLDQANAVFLVKGSRSASMDKVAELIATDSASDQRGGRNAFAHH